MSEDDGAQKPGDPTELAEIIQRDLQVGYRRPPKHTQFRPGQSGNPLGRPTRTISIASELADELSRTIQGHGGEITQVRAIVRRLVADAVAGDAKVALMLIGLCAKLFRDQEADPRAAEDDAFVEKLGAREPDAAEKIADASHSDEAGE